MQLVVDTNVVFSALIADGKTRESLLYPSFDLYVPEHFFQELDDNRSTVEEKTGLSESELNLLTSILFERIHATPREEFKDEIPRAREALSEDEPGDSAFLALAIHLDAAVWSDDQDFRKQDVVQTYTTEEILERHGFI